MNGRTCLVTGGTSGVGLATAAGLARLGASVLIVGRSPVRGKAALEVIRSESGNPDVELLCADLSAQRSVRGLARFVEAERGALHVLVNAAGILLLERRLTVDGVEMTLAVDYLSHFLLTNLLLGLLKRSAPSRVVTVTGGPRTLRNASLDPDDLDPAGPFKLVGAAVRAAAARLIFSLELARRIEGTGVTSNAFHPGLVRSHLTRNLPFCLRIPFQLMQPFLKAACPTGVYLASSPEVQRVSGRYFVDETPVEPIPGGFTSRVAQALWEVSERLTGLK
jgi:NAD(P)-dependent dehydrogenase (short-subunit alcohol dehydrogenase family)